MIEPRYVADASRGLQVFFVIFQDSDAALPDADYCQVKREELGLTMPVLYDGEGTFAEAYGVTSSDTSFVFAAGGQIVERSHGENDQVEALLEQLLSAPVDAGAADASE